MGHALQEEKRYKSKTMLVAPGEARARLRNYTHSILGFSLQNCKFENPRLESIVHWIDRRFGHCVILIGDSMHRITLQIMRGIGEDEAWEEAKAMGNAAVTRALPLFEKTFSSCRFEVMRCSGIHGSAECAAVRDQLCALFEEDDNFRNSILGFADEFMKRGARSGIAPSSAKVRLSCDYMLEELAILEVLARQRTSVFVYPGSLAPLTEISNGEHPGAPDGLKNLVNVALHVRRRRNQMEVQ